MNKNQLIETISQESDLKKTEASRVLDALFQTIKESLIQGQEVAWGGFGKFKVTNRRERQARNIRTGDSITIPAKAVPAFVASKALKEAVNNK